MIEEPKSSRIVGDELVIDTQGGSETYDAKYLVAALLVLVAKGDGTISEDETQQMMALMEEQFQMSGAESLALLTRTMSDIAENPDLGSLLGELSAALNVADKEDIAVMLLKVVAADGRKDAQEMEKLRVAGEMIDIAADTMHRAFDRYFEESRVLPVEDP
jgi:uncharacterized tellurite resistance protein B-like protein